MIESKEGRKRRCVLHDVLFVPELAYNLLSVAKATQDGVSVVFNNCECCIYDQDEKSLAKATKSGRLYHLKTDAVKEGHVQEIHATNVDCRRQS